eukprot:g7249.t1
MSYAVGVLEEVLVWMKFIVVAPFDLLIYLVQTRSYILLCVNAFLTVFLYKWFYPLDFLQWLWNSLYKRCVGPPARKKRGRNMRGAGLTFDPDSKTMLLHGIAANSDLSMDVVCTYELPTKTWYNVRPKFQCRLSTSKHILCLKGNKGCEFSDDIVKITVEHAQLFCSSTSNGLHLYPTLETVTDRPVRLISVQFEVSLENVLLERLSQSKMFINGFQSWSPTGSVGCDSRMSYTLMGLPFVSRPVAGMMHNVDSEYWGRDDGLTSQHMTAFQNKGDSDSVLLGFTKQNKATGEFFFHRASKHLQCSLDYGKTLFSTEIGEHGRVRLKLESLLIMRGNIDALMETWASECAPENYHRTLREIESPIGWCSWYKYYDKISQDIVKKNVEALVATPDLKCKVVQLDDGYQSQIGDWLTTNRKFPDGLPGVAREIRKHGMEAGIWLAPFVAGRGSVLFRSRPEWFVRDSLTGTPLIGHLNPDWGSDFLCYCLDTTNPQVQAWLTHVFSTLVAYGFSYFKIDFLVAGIRRGERYDRYSSRVEAYRKGLEVIRKAIGPKSYLVGCGAPMGPSIGHFSAMRVSSDTSASWDVIFLHKIMAAGDGPPALKNALHFTLTRSFLHRKWWLNDPDCVLFADDGLTTSEVLLQLTVIGMSGGVVVISEDMTDLKFENIKLLKKILPPSNLACGQARNLLFDRYPQMYVCGGGDPSTHSSLFAFINWEDRSVIVDAEEKLEHELSRMTNHQGSAQQLFSQFLLFDFWNERLLQKDFRLTIDCHGSRTLLATMFDNKPVLVGNSFNLSAMVDGRIEGHVSDEHDSFIVNVTGIACRSGKLWIALPTRMVSGLDAMRIDSNVSANIWDVEDCPARNGWNIVQVSVSAGKKEKWYVKLGCIS